MLKVGNPIFANQRSGTSCNVVLIMQNRAYVKCTTLWCTVFTGGVVSCRHLDLTRGGSKSMSSLKGLVSLAGIWLPKTFRNNMNRRGRSVAEVRWPNCERKNRDVRKHAHAAWCSSTGKRMGSTAQGQRRRLMPSNADIPRDPAQQLMLMLLLQLPQPLPPVPLRPCPGTKLQSRDGGAEGMRCHSGLPSADASQPPPAAATTARPVSKACRCTRGCLERRK